MKKPFWKSKTVWLNIAVGAVATAMTWDNPAQIAQGLALANVLLRFLTTGGISVAGED